MKSNSCGGYGEVEVVGTAPGSGSQRRGRRECPKRYPRPLGKVIAVYIASGVAGFNHQESTTGKYRAAGAFLPTQDNSAPMGYRPSFRLECEPHGPGLCVRSPHHGGRPGGQYGGDPDETTVFPQTMLVDYVRIYERE